MGGRTIPLNLDAASVDLDELDAFLMSDQAPEDCMQLSDLDGFLTAVAIGPDVIMPSEWLPVIWGVGEPDFASMEDASRILGTIMGRYNQILQHLREEPEAYEPVFWETPEGDPVAADWAEGFMDGVALCQEAWRPLIESEVGNEMLAPIIAFLHDEDGSPLVEGDAAQLNELHEIAVGLIVPSVHALNRYWQARRGPSRRGSKAGRNDACACGSGRKYKRCCGAN